MNDRIPPSKQALAEALSLSADILKNIELSEAPLSSIALKTCRLARLLNDFEYQKAFEFEASGYPREPSGVPADAWKIAILAGRIFKSSDKNEIKELCYLESIAELEEIIETGKASLSAAIDPSVSVSSANPNQYVLERQTLRNSIQTNASRLSSRKSFIYSYANTKHNELKFSEISDDIFSRLREGVDRQINDIVPTATQKFSAIYNNLRSENPEDWSNGVHSCRRLLQDLADAIFPSRESKSITENGKQKEINLGPDNYINRLIAFIQENADSKNFQSIVGSNLSFIGDRLDAVFAAAQKGSHATIYDRGEADRYVIYTYLVIGDIVSLKEKSSTVDGLNHQISS
jgi:AbiTii